MSAHDTDLDELVLYTIAFEACAYVGDDGGEFCMVPRDLLQRVAARFDVQDVRQQQFGRVH